MDAGRVPVAPWAHPVVAALGHPLYAARKEGNCICFFFFVLYSAMPSITNLCKELRLRQTPAEDVLWDYLRNRNIKKHKFLRQHPIYVPSPFDRRRLFYIPDFYCSKCKLVIEADGPIHLLKQE
jgi:very-short-patch-repair endonuclease